MTDHKIISGDTHIVEPPDLYTSRISAKWSRVARQATVSLRQGTSYDSGHSC